MSGLDRRTMAIGGDVAAASLEGVAPAARYVKPTAMRVIAPVAPIRLAPHVSAEQADALLFGETFDALEHHGDHVWGQARRDGYVGFVARAALSDDICVPSHWVAALRTFAFETPSIKAPARGPLSLNALVTVEDETQAFALARGVGWISRAHLQPVGRSFDDPASIAQRFLGTPYLWGGRDSIGLDCSGLVQQALYACGLACPRDSDQQAAIGAPAPPPALRRGDLVFWKGHVGMMLDPRRLLHANAFHMMVAIEPLVEAEARILAAAAGSPIAFRRLQISPFIAR